MVRMTDRNSNGSIDILDDWGRCRYTIQNNENGLIADIGRKLAEYEDDAEVMENEWYDRFRKIWRYFNNSGCRI